MVRICIQRVKNARVEIHRQGLTRTVGNIKNGMMVLVGFTQGDTKAKAQAMAKKMCTLRLWSDINDENKSWITNVVQREFKILLVSQFTMYAVTKGTKPDFHHALNTEPARELYYDFVEMVRQEYNTLARQYNTQHPALSVPKLVKFDYKGLEERIDQHFSSQNEILKNINSNINDKSSLDTISNAILPDDAPLNKFQEGFDVFDFDQYVQTTLFGADMSVHLCNDGPVTINLESPPDQPKADNSNKSSNISQKQKNNGSTNTESPKSSNPQDPAVAPSTQPSDSV